jgi:trehalose synthase
MWKARPVLASRVGGIQEQITDDRNGLLLDDPSDLAAFGRATATLLEEHERAARPTAACAIITSHLAG